MLDNRVAMKWLAGFVFGTALLGAAANAQPLEVRVDASLAHRILGIVCSGEPVDRDWFRASPVVGAQIEHHTELSSTRDLDALLRGLEAASRCEVPEDDPFRFGPVVRNKAGFEQAVAFLERHASDIEEFVVRSVTPFVPADLEWSGSIVLSIVGNPCGGFGTKGRFFLALNCLVAHPESDYSAVRVVSAHEVYHALQDAFFHPRDGEFDDVASFEAALSQLFWWLETEGTAEYVGDSRQIEGSGVLSGFLGGFARDGYGRIPLYLRFLGYAADILAAADDYRERVRDVYELGFSGTGRQVFYYAGAAMTAHLDRTYGREALVCILGLPSEEFVLAYQATALESPGEDSVPLGRTLVQGAERLRDSRPPGSATFHACLQQVRADRMGQENREGEGAWRKRSESWSSAAPAEPGA